MAEVELSNIRVVVRVGATINLGDFNNYKPEYEIQADVAEGTSPSAAKEKLRQAARAWLDADIETVTGKSIR